MDQLWPIALGLEEEFKPPYVTVGEKATAEWKKIFSRFSSDYLDVTLMV
ncbi:MAG: hypothetical protein HN436_11235 [Oceanospirillaceae bacterium]|nr:hypothetical protein [Oceanospirillaceae bacterium]